MSVALGLDAITGQGIYMVSFAFGATAFPLYSVSSAHAFPVMGGGMVRLALEPSYAFGGIVTHQGHKHSRVNRYRALYTLAPQADGELRIAPQSSELVHAYRRIPEGLGTPAASQAS